MKERIYLDKNAPNTLRDEVTLIDHAYTRPWTVSKGYLRVAEKFPSWPEQNCPETTRLIKSHQSQDR